MLTKHQQRQQRRQKRKKPLYLSRAAARKRATTIGRVSQNKAKALASQQQLLCALTRTIQHLNEYPGFKLQDIANTTRAWAATKRLHRANDDTLLPSTYEMTAWTVQTILSITTTLFKDQLLVDAFQDEKNIIKVCQELHRRLDQRWQRKMSFTFIPSTNGRHEDIVKRLNQTGLGGGTVKQMSTWLNLVLRAALAQAFAPKTLEPMLNDPSYFHKQQANIINAQDMAASAA